jgi:hypothetical protein
MWSLGNTHSRGRYLQNASPLSVIPSGLRDTGGSKPLQNVTVGGQPGAAAFVEQ